MYHNVGILFNPHSSQIKHLIYLNKPVITDTTHHDNMLPILIFNSILTHKDEFKLKSKTNVIFLTFVLLSCHVSTELRLVHAYQGTITLSTPTDSIVLEFICMRCSQRLFFQPCLIYEFVYRQTTVWYSLYHFFQRDILCRCYEGYCLNELKLYKYRKFLSHFLLC